MSRASQLIILFLSGAFVGHAACTARPEGGEARESCLLDEANGVYHHEKKTACGCEQRVCTENTVCFQHDCCNPEVDGRLPESCGCAEVCGADELCVAYGDARGTACCDPKTADDRDFCGCVSACLDTEACVQGPDGTFGCVCSPELAAYYDDNCGCTGKVCDGPDDCIEGGCRCNPLNDAAKTSDLDCGCNGPCPPGSHCRNGACACEGENNVICCVGEDGAGCEKACVPQDECYCQESAHLSDDLNCGCKGPCAAGDRCDDGSCGCSPLAHAIDNANCGCEGPCAAGLECQGGKCVCPAWKLSDPHDCACAGPCAEGVECVNGICASCPTEKLSDPADCGCKGPCPKSYECNGGQCTCPEWKYSDESDCACGGPCKPGDACVNGICQCPPAKMTDPSDCGCQGACPMIANGPNMVCSSGLCGCPQNYNYCHAVKNIADGVKFYTSACLPDIYQTCADCYTVCTNGQICAYDHNGEGDITNVYCKNP